MVRPNDIQPLCVNHEYDLMLYLWSTTDYITNVLARYISLYYTMISQNFKGAAYVLSCLIRRTSVVLSNNTPEITCITQ